MRLASRDPLLTPAFASSFVPINTAPCKLHLSPLHCVPRQPTVVAQAKLHVFSRPIVPAKPLLSFVEDKAQTRRDVIRAINSYVKEHNLQDPNDRRVFHCDDLLKSVLGVDKCTFIQVTRHVSPYFIKPEDVGGRYLEEASAIEQAILSEQSSDDAPKKKNRTKSQSRKAGARADKKAGRNLYRPMRLSDDLAAVCRASEMQRQEVIKAVWNYIRMNNLQGQGPRETPIKCDFLLRKIFNADYINARSVMGGISPHMSKKE